jgi:uncharacterized membrane protein
MTDTDNGMLPGPEEPGGDGSGPAVQGRAPRWMRWLLIGSLTANLLVIGTVAGALFDGDGPRGLRGGITDIGLGPFTEALSREDKAALRDAFVARVPNFRKDRRQDRRDAVALLAQLQAQPLDEAALRATFEAQRARIAARVDVGQDLLIARIVAMSPEERAAFAGRLAQAMRDMRAPGGKPGAGSAAP